MSPKALKLLGAGAVVVLLIVLASLLIAGGDGDPDEFSREVDENFAEFSAEDVRQHFEALTGFELESSATGDVLEVLSVPGGRDGARVRNRYGSFSVFVTGNEQTLDRITGAGVTDDETKIYDNVAVSIFSSPDGPGIEGTERLQKIFETLGESPEDVELPE